MAIRSFADRGTEDINYERRTKASLRTLPLHLHNKARLKLARLHASASLADLASLPGNRFEKLRGDREGQYSIRLNDQFRLCFHWSGKSAESVQIVDYH